MRNACLARWQPGDALFEPNQATPPNFPYGYGYNLHDTVKMNNSVTRVVSFMGFWPKYYDGGPIEVNIAAATGTTESTGATIRFLTAFERWQPGTTDIDGFNWSSQLTQDYGDLNTAQGQMNAGTKEHGTGFIDGITAGDMFRLEVERQGAASADDAAGPILIKGVWLIEL